MKAFVLNYTSYENHIGCISVCSTIDSLLSGFGFEAVHRFGLPQIDSVVASIDAVAPDFVFLNGEGTLHSSSSVALKWLDICAYAKSRYGSKFIVLNASLFMQGDLFEHYLRGSDLVVARECASYDNFSNILGHKRLILCPDFSFFSFPDVAPCPRNIDLVVGDSVIYQDAKALYGYAKDKGFSTISLYLCHSIADRLRVAWRQCAKRNRSMVSVFADFFTRSLFLRNSFSGADDFFSFLCRVDGVVTGRFHQVCACIFYQVPFLYLPSNTPKIQALMQTIGIENRALTSIDDLNGLFHVPQFDDEELQKISNYVSSGERSFSIIKSAIGDMV